MATRILLPKELKFDPSLTLESGQVFRWSPVGNGREDWLGIVSGRLLKISKRSVVLLGEVEGGERHLPNESLDELASKFLSFGDDLDEITRSFPRDKYIGYAIQQFPGLRLLTQDPWECLVSFLCSINCNIPSIKMKIENLSSMFGKKIRTDLDVRAYSFPDAQTLARATRRELLACRLGFRWRYVSSIARSVSEGRLDLRSLSSAQYDQACEQLISEISGTTMGIGPKVADCVLLFSLRKMEAFPIDVWILRCLKENYSKLLYRAGSSGVMAGLPIHLTLSEYKRVGDNLRSYFGRYAGYAQQLLYVKRRAEGFANSALIMKN